jgi:hypothetical protein
MSGSTFYILDHERHPVAADPDTWDRWFKNIEQRRLPMMFSLTAFASAQFFSASITATTAKARRSCSRP